MISCSLMDSDDVTGTFNTGFLENMEGVLLIWVYLYETVACIAACPYNVSSTCNWHVNCDTAFCSKRERLFLKVKIGESVGYLKSFMIPKIMK